MTLLARPSTDEAFRDAVADSVAAWRRADDHEGVVSVVDWGRRPNPWIATEYVTETLADRGAMGTATALWNARAIAEAVAHAHDRGVVHGGLDPGAIVYRDDDFEGRRRPRVTDVGLASAFRRHVSPSAYLDRRFAAPEYFDADYGAVDAATDVYHLGALLYALVAGRPPFEGSPAAVRRGVLGGSPRPPSEVADVPSAVDDVVRRATATRKLVRYDSVRELLGDLDGLAPDG
jgi:serine/threonine protein kinase